jgi:alpha-galactosidase
MRDNGPNGWCWDAEAHVKNTTLYMKSSGLFALGYNRVNIDEGWLAGRNAQGEMYEDLSKFPSGMKGLGDWVKAQGFHYGLYSCRGTCQCGTNTYHAPGSHGYEAADVDWMVAAGADYRAFGARRLARQHPARAQTNT